MDYFRFAYPHIFYILIPIWIIAIVYRWRFYRAPIYRYPLTGQIKKTPHAKKGLHKAVLFMLKSILLFFMIFLIARPQWVDSRSKVTVEGVDIMIALDVSGSMQFFDDLQDRRQRITVAKSEAINFIKKRPDDPIGIVIFGADAISRCPLTLDKTILTTIIHETQLGMINPNGTSLGTGLATAVNKLKRSKAKSRIIILLTDGQPTPPTETVPVSTALELAKKFDIKVYCIAIGNKKGGYAISAFNYVQQTSDSVNEKLLQTIASQTNGRFFRANNPKEMRAIYDTINKLERTEHETNLFSRYYEAFASFIWLLLLFLLIELLLKLFIWRGIV